MGIVLLTLVFLGFGADSYKHHQLKKNENSTHSIEQQSEQPNLSITSHDGYVASTLKSHSEHAAMTQ